ncbi:MAG: hypothetical protein AB7I33_05155 [Gemmatimonadales bacterium]
MRILRALVFLALLGGLSSSRLAGQVLSQARLGASTPAMSNDRAPSAPRQPGQARSTSMAFGGTVGGVTGFMAGALVASGLSRNCGGEFCGLEAAFLGGLIGETLAIPLGVHLANRSRGNFGTALAGSVVSGAAALLLLDATGEGALVLAVPLAQIVTSVLVEGRTMAR